MESIKKIFRTPTAFVLLLVAIFSLIGVIIQNKSAETIARIPIDATLTAEAKLTENANISSAFVMTPAAMIPQPLPTATLLLPASPRPTFTTIPGWEGRSSVKGIDEPRTFYANMSAGGYERNNVRMAIDLDANQPYSLNEKAIITEIGDVLYCSESSVTNAHCPYLLLSNDTQIIENAWIKDKNIITWILPFKLPIGKAFSISLSFKPNPAIVKDGDIIHVNAIQHWIDKDYSNLDKSKDSLGQLYVIQIP